MKVVPDSMMWVSYSVTQDGFRHQILEKAVAGRVRLFASAYILNEVGRALAEDFGWNSRQVMLAGKAILRICRLVKLPETIRAFVPGDPNDDAIIQTAITAKAKFVVTSDKVLLELRKVQDVEVISMNEFADFLSNQP